VLGAARYALLARRPQAEPVRQDQQANAEA